MNEKWLNNRTQAYGVFEAGGVSDHLRGRFHMTAEAVGKRKPFKFTNVVAETSEFMEVIGNYWKDMQPLFQSTSALYRFSKYLKGLKPHLRTLSKSKLGSLTKKVKEAYSDLCVKKEQMMRMPTPENVYAEREAFARWQRVSDIEEKVSKQRSKVHWLQVGDKNNKAFYNAAKIRESRNAIREIKCADGSCVTTQDDIKKEAERFFNEFLTFEPRDVETASVEELKETIPYRCTEEERTKLTRVVTEEEIKEVVFNMPSNKSPGPDGYTTEFFKASWSIIGKDFTAAVQSFFSKGFLPKGLNSTILALIPKKESAQEMRDYRPISCCNVLYKVISKIIANQLKGTLPQCISYNQSAFVKDRLLVENLLLATEIVKDYHKEDVSPRGAMKIDIAKAFDSVHWPFLLNTLRALNMSEEFIHWIELCVCTASFSVQVNGELAGFFQSKRGLRQGCALSPYLFEICMNVLSGMLDKAVERKQVGYHPKCKNIMLSHLCFADDLLVFTDGTKRSVEGILTVFKNFASISGLKISLEKSTLYTVGIQDNTREDILREFPFASGQLPVRYLGLPLLTKRMTVSDYLPLVEKVRKRMSSWTGRFLSHAGRLQLIKSVITSLANFWMAAFRLPGSCLKEIERLCSAFLWSGPELKTTKAKVSWREVCFPKNEGGLEMRPLKEINKVYGLKLIWRLMADSSLWVRWIQCYLIRKNSFWSIKENTSSGSWVWKKLLKLRGLAQQFLRKEIRNGECTSFWYESWSRFGPLIEILGERGPLDLGIPNSFSVAEVKRMRRRRNHRVDILNQVEEEIRKLGNQQDEDITLWKHAEGKYMTKFTTSNTWDQIRDTKPICDWSKGVWFSHSTPKYSFMMWVALKGRLQTTDRMMRWNNSINTECVLCNEESESCAHLFFGCRFSENVWRNLAGGLMQDMFTTDWSNLIRIVSKPWLTPIKTFLLRYTL